MRRQRISGMSLVIAFLCMPALSLLDAQELNARRDTTPRSTEALKADSSVLRSDTLKADSSPVLRGESRVQVTGDSVRTGAGGAALSLRNLFVQELVRATTSFEAGPTGLKVSNIPGWMFLVLVIGAVLSGILTSRAKPESNTGMATGLFTVILVAALLIIGGYWFGRWRVQRDLARAERALVVLQQNASDAEAQVLAARDTITSLRVSLTQAQESLTTASMKVITPNMVWAIILGAFVLLLPLTWVGTPDRLRRLRRRSRPPSQPETWRSAQ